MPLPDGRGGGGRRHRNVLPNTYVPMHTTKVLASVLSRLAKTSTVALVLLWPTLQNTQPVKPCSKTPEFLAMSQRDFARYVCEKAKEMNHKTWTKARVVDAILYDFWPRGLNLLQLAQVDCQLIVDNPNAHLWISSTVKNAWGHEVPLSLDPPVFLDRLAAQLSNLFMLYIYVCTHPTFPLVLIRIQVFDITPSTSTQSRKTVLAQPHISSHRPYFLAIPMNAPHVIHSPGDDLVSQTVLQVVESCLCKGPSEALRLETPAHQKPVRSLHLMHILKGSSRFAHSLGSWTPYADGEGDISPLARHDRHLVVLSVTSSAESYANDEEKLYKLANLRFKGSALGELTSKVLFDHPNPSKRRKIRSKPDDTDHPRTKNVYASLAPISVAEFEIQEPLEPADSLKDSTLISHVKIKMIGTDVFAGMHELASTSKDPETSFIDLETLPGWLTGEEGESCGVVRKGIFHTRNT